MSDVVEFKSGDDVSEISFKPEKNARAQEQEVADCTEFLKIEYTKFKGYKVLLEAIEKCIDDTSLDAELRAKIKKIILGEQVSAIVLYDSPIQDTVDNVLGEPTSTAELTYSESNKLRTCLVSKCVKFKSGCNSFLDVDILPFDAQKNESPMELAQDDFLLLEYRNTLETEQQSYVKNQLELIELLEELKNIRLQILPKVTEQKYQECYFRTHINYLKSQLAKHKYRIDIFKESNNSFKAYTEFIMDIKQQQQELQLEIGRLKDLRRKYSDVSCKEYDDILESYLQYKSSLEKRKLMYELCV